MQTDVRCEMETEYASSNIMLCNYQRCGISQQAEIVHLINVLSKIVKCVSYLKK